ESIKKPKTPKETKLCDSLMNKTQAMLTQDVMVCPMNTTDEVINFRRLFILLVCKFFFFPSPRATVSQFHTHAALNVSAPNKIYWARHIYDKLISAATRFQDKGNKTVDGCLYALLIRYLTTNLYGDLEEYSGQQPWVRSWPLSTLENTIVEDTTSPSELLSHIYCPDAGTSYSRSKVRAKNKSAAVAPKSKPEGIGAHKKSNCKEKVSNNTSERGHLSPDNTPEVTLETKNVVPEPVKM
ncbi:hypothetical protein PIB30_093701, partial [Stylosanthes scabra]|nr:hypothetical protein [Stylosanthes scabra]